MTFVKYGDFYDLTVPGAEHYLAQGLYNHNSGKTCAGVMKTLHRLRRGMDGIALSPNLPHFKRSLWPELQRWIPWDCVVEKHRHMGDKTWEPYMTFKMGFHNELGGISTLILGGIENPRHFEGPNLSFAYMDEARGIKEPEALRVLSGRVRINGPREEPPQLFITTTTEMHWLFDYFGDREYDNPEKDDPFYGFKQQARVITLLSEDNVKAGNLSSNFIETRGGPLSEAQRRVRLEGAWGYEDDPSHFLESIIMWDVLKEDLPPLRKKKDPERNWSDTVVLGVDAAVSRDTFVVVAVSRHPKNRELLAVRDVRIWQAPKNGKIDFEGTEDRHGPEMWVRWMCEHYSVASMVYDSFQLHQMSTRLARDGVVWTKEFSQTSPRTKADQSLYDLILQHRIAHDGNLVLRDHLQNADAEVDEELHKRRIVKRQESLKIDAAVALSMASFEALRLNL